MTDEQQSREPSDWYVVMTAPAKEIEAARGLRQRGYAVCLPMQSSRRQYERKDGRKMVLRQHKAWLKGYLFARLGEGQSVYTINNAPQVSRVVYVGDRAVTVSDAELDELRRYLRSLAKAPKPQIIELYDPGTRVEFLEPSPYVGIRGRVAVDRGTTIRISIPNSSWPVIVSNREHVRPVGSVA